MTAKHPVGTEIPQEIEDALLLMWQSMLKDMREGYSFNFIQSIKEVLRDKGFSIVSTKDKYVLDREQLWNFYNKTYQGHRTKEEFDSLLAKLTGQANPGSETEGTEEER